MRIFPEREKELRDSIDSIYRLTRSRVHRRYCVEHTIDQIEDIDEKDFLHAENLELLDSNSGKIVLDNFCIFPAKSCEVCRSDSRNTDTMPEEIISLCAWIIDRLKVWNIFTVSFSE